MSSPAYYTEEGLRKLQEELHRMRTVDRPHLSQQIADARDKGDLSENAEYHAAKEEQGLLEARIAKLEEVVANARIIDASQLDTSKVYIHCTVKVRHVVTDAHKHFTDLINQRVLITNTVPKELGLPQLAEFEDGPCFKGNSVNRDTTRHHGYP